MPAVNRETALDFAEIAGQAHAKRALEVAAAGGHSITLVGPPGVGKTALARSLIHLLPPFSQAERDEVVAAGGDVAGLVRPVREIDNLASPTAVLGGKIEGKQHLGELSRAHGGVVILDELPRMRPEVRNALADVLISGCVPAEGVGNVIHVPHGTHNVRRPAAVTCLPAAVVMVVVMCPCPCGYFGHGQRRCTCTPSEAGRYLAGYPDDLLQRVELHVELPPLRYRDLAEKHRERSESVAGQVQAARDRQRDRWGDGLLRLNSRVPWGEAEPHCRPSATGVRLIKVATERLGYSELSRTQVLRVARTIADLSAEDTIGGVHVAEAIQSCVNPWLRLRKPDYSHER
ncbi:MAG TPA: ATP-binding protein [Longimicrobium sp.]